MSMRKSLNQESIGTVFDEQERQKLLRLNRDVRDTQEPRLEWLYTGDRIQSEDYLLGKKFDGDTNNIIQSNTNESITTSTIDLANKIREDPLFLIKKKEIEQRQRILENPVRLKHLRDLLERQESTQSSHKRRHHSRTPSPSHRHRRSPPRRRSRSPPPPRRRSRSPPPPPRRRSRSPPPPRRRSRSPPPRHRRRTPPPPPPPPTSSRRPEKHSKEERDHRIREMLTDGAIRNEQRERNVRSYKERDEQEEK